MAQEIERKFLVRDDSYRTMAVASIELAQAYLSTDPDATVRVRVSGERAWLTVKSRNEGAVRGEWEYMIPRADAMEMLQRCCGSTLVEKTRYIVPAEGGLRWEVDEFHGRHSGLVLAEIELPSEDTPFALPAFAGEEVTGNAAYYNSTLAKG